jgi:hypothetical protein
MIESKNENNWFRVFNFNFEFDNQQNFQLTKIEIQVVKTSTLITKKNLNEKIISISFLKNIFVWFVI